ncbi:MAG: hypothetical protein J7576_00940 [Siphonobacter aquaeclarae]|nr:hypothetical protein [Siphonobacter aquaeclarae]
MKTCLLLCALAYSSIVHAQLLLEENTDYPPGDLTAVSNGNWIAINTGPEPQSAGSGLTYPGYGSSGIGAGIQLTDGGGKEVYRPFLHVNSGILYTAFLLSVNTASPGGDYFFSLSKQAPVGTNYMCRLYVRSSGGGYQLGFSKSSEVPSYGPTVLSFGATVLVVMRYEFVSGANNDPAGLFIDPVSTVEGVPDIQGDVTAYDGNTPYLGTVVLRQNRTDGTTFTPDVMIDGIRVAHTYQQALPVELVSWKAKPEREAVNLTWITASEKNNSHFIPERADDARTFVSLGRVAASGGPGVRQSYAFVDENPPRQTAYYRLRMVDQDGSEAFSDVISVEADEPWSARLLGSPQGREIRLSSNRPFAAWVFDERGLGIPATVRPEGEAAYLIALPDSERERACILVLTEGRQRRSFRIPLPR